MQRPEEQGTAGRGDGVTRYRMRQKLMSIGDDYWIESEDGQPVFKVDGKALRFRQTLSFKDAAGAELLEIHEQLLHIKDTMTIETPDGREVATVKKSRFTPFHEHFSVKRAGEPDLEVHGNIGDHEYTIVAGHRTFASVSKRWFHLRDIYGIEIQPGQDDVLFLAIAVIIDQLAHAAR